MFNLQLAVAEWRRQTLAAGVRSPAILDELESHLREEIEGLAQSGLDDERAFASALQNIGPIRAIQTEFEKVDRTQKRRHWRAFEILFFFSALINPFLVGSLAFIFKNGAFSEMTFGQQLSSVAAATVFSLLAWGMQSSCGKFPVILTHRIRDVIFVPVVLWPVALAHVIMPRIDFTVSQSAVASLWGFAPMGLLIGWAWGNSTAARKRIQAA